MPFLNQSYRGGVAPSITLDISKIALAELQNWLSPDIIGVMTESSTLRLTDRLSTHCSRLAKSVYVPLCSRDTFGTVVIPESDEKSFGPTQRRLTSFSLVVPASCRVSPKHSSIKSSVELNVGRATTEILTEADGSKVNPQSLDSMTT